MKIYVIASTYKDIDLTIQHFFTPEKAVKELGMLTEDDWDIKPEPSDDPEDYIEEFYKHVSEEEIYPKINLELKIIDV